MDEETELLLTLLLLLQTQAAALYVLWRMEYSKRWLTRRWLVHPINTMRPTESFFVKYFAEVKLYPDKFFKYTRMSLETFNFLNDLLEPYLTKTKSDICAEARLIITLRYLATGDSIDTLAGEYRIGDSTCRNIIKQTAEVIFNVLSPTYLKLPTESEWKKIANGFLVNWNIPNCVGAMDGKHIRIQAPPNSNSVYYNRKHFFSIVLLAVCNHNYEFNLFDVGAVGSESDGGIYKRSELGKALKEKRLNLPHTTKQLPGSNIELPYFFVGDGAFQMTRNLLRPYTGRFLDKKKLIFNYRLSRARRVIENAFGILSARWRFLLKPAAFHPSSVNKCVLASICLHNFLLRNKKFERQYCPPGFVDHEDNCGNTQQGNWRNEINELCEIDEFQELNDVANIHFNDADIIGAENMRDTLATYFMTPEGSVPWQAEYLSRGTYHDAS